MQQALRCAAPRAFARRIRAATAAAACCPPPPWHPSPTQLQVEVAQLQQVLVAREREVVALREIAEAASNLQSADTQAAKARRPRRPQRGGRPRRGAARTCAHVPPGRPPAMRRQRPHSLTAAHGPSHPLTCPQVIELSKKNRSLNLLLEREKQRVAQLQQALSEAAAPATSAASGLRAGSPPGGGAAARTNAAARSAVEAAAEAAEAAAKEAGVWRERAQQLTNKLAQTEQKVPLLSLPQICLPSQGKFACPAAYWQRQPGSQALEQAGSTRAARSRCQARCSSPRAHRPSPAGAMVRRRWSRWRARTASLRARSRARWARTCPSPRCATGC